MYTINLDDVPHFNLSNARQFVGFWSKCYRDDKKDDTYYFPNIENDLTEPGLRELLWWKDAYRFTDPIRSGPNAGKRNPRVKSVLDNFDHIKQFRKGQIKEDEMWSKAEELFESGLVYKAFLLHIAQPHAYPIADQHVFRAWSLHTRRKEDKPWDTYVAYREYFEQIAEAMGVKRTMENIRPLKKIDSALFEFGKFLKDYCCPHFSTDANGRASNA